MKVTQLCPTFCDPMGRIPWVYIPWNSPAQNTGVGSLSLLQGIFLTQGSNPGLLHCRGFVLAEPQGKPKNTGMGSLSLFQWIFPTQESTGVSCIAGKFFTNYQGIFTSYQVLYQLSGNWSYSTVNALRYYVITK